MKALGQTQKLGISQPRLEAGRVPHGEPQYLQVVVPRPLPTSCLVRASPGGTHVLQSLSGKVAETAVGPSGTVATWSYVSLNYKFSSSVTLPRFEHSAATRGWLVATILGSTDTAHLHHSGTGRGFPGLEMWISGHTGCSRKGSGQRPFSLLGTSSMYQSLPLAGYLMAGDRCSVADKGM